MSESSAYIAQCGFCGLGLVRLFRCNECNAVIAICDECERLWRDPEFVHADPNARADGAHPNCPACPNGDVTWTPLDDTAISANGLERLVVGRSS